MAPKAKSKAKGKGKGKEDEVPKMDVPPPPPAPVCLPFPEDMVERYSTERCLLLAWADPQNQYKIQVRPYTPGGSVLVPTGPEDKDDPSWSDAKELERVQLSNRHTHEARLIPCEHVRLQYRVVLEAGPKVIDGLYVANWQSAPSEPIASYVDPPVELKAELRYESNLLPPTVALSWKSSNMEWLRKAMGDDKSNEHGPFAAWPGMMPVRAQVRWRVTRVLSSGEGLPNEVAGGRHFISPAIDSMTMDASFHFRDDHWTLTYREAVEGVVARFSVRVGTAYRWSPWSEEAAEVEVEVPEPAPIQHDHDVHLELKRIEDREVELEWPPFFAKGVLSWVEYRVRLYRLDSRNDIPQWDKNSVTVTTFVMQKQPDMVSATVPDLCPNTWYMVCVDARYPHISKRAWSTVKTYSAPFVTPFPARPPLQPLPVGVEDAIEAGDLLVPPVEDSVDGGYNWPAMPWVALRIESRYFEDYVVEYKAATVADGEQGGEYYKGWRVPAALEPMESAEPECLTPRRRLGSSCFSTGASTSGTVDNEADSGGAPWRLVRVGLEPTAPEVVVCRLVHRRAIAGISPFHWSICTPPLVPRVAPATFASPAAWTQLNDKSLKLGVRFFLHPGETIAEEHAVQSDTGFMSSQVHKDGHRFVTRYQLRVRGAPATTSLDGEGDAPRRSWETLVPCVMPQPRDAYVSAGSRPAKEATDYQSNVTTPSRSGTKGSVAASDTTTGPGAKALLASFVQCLGWSGVRYEVDIDPGDPLLRTALRTGQPFEIGLRVGTDHRWSPWVSIGDGDESQMDSSDSEPELPIFTVPVPTPLKDDELECTPSSATRLRIGWQPFNRLPGITRVEYVVRATPIFGEADHDAGPEGAGPVERVLLVAHEPRQSDEDALRSREARRLLDAHEVQVQRLFDLANAFREKGNEADRDASRKVYTELWGLLPCTRYEVSVSARYPAAATEVATTAGAGSNVTPEISPTASATMPEHSRSMTKDSLTKSGPVIVGAVAPPAPEHALVTTVEIPGGKSAPAAPHEAEPTVVAGAAEDGYVIEPDARAAMLRMRAPAGYVLEYRAAGPGTAHFAPQVGVGRTDFSGSWQGEGAAPWRRVPAVRSIVGGEPSRSMSMSVLAPKGGGDAAHFGCGFHENESGCDVTVIVELPGFGSQAPMPDAVEFRQCAVSRSAAHPCRWAGGVSEPVAVCFAPPHRAPRVKRVLSDEKWCLTLAVELFKVSAAPRPPKLIQDSSQDEDSENEDDDKELMELRRMHMVPAPHEESWEETDIGRIPVGYGHRMATQVQFRYSLQTALSPALRRQVEDKTAPSGWHLAPPAELRPEGLSGTQYTLEVTSDAALLDSGVYMFQVRVGNGSRWSAWSRTSSAFAFRVPPPTPPVDPVLGTQNPVTVEMVTSTVARVRWCDFQPAPGLAMLEYEVRANPQQNSQNRHNAAAVAVATFDHRYRGGFIEHEVPNLLPFTPYVFSVQAQYPRIGSRGWAGRQESEPTTLEALIASQDPPTPLSVPDVEGERETEDQHGGGRGSAGGGGGGDGAEGDSSSAVSCFATLAYPEEEDGAPYDLEYAHVLGDEADTSELRTSQCLWHAPTEVVLLTPGPGSAQQMPQWRVQLPDIRMFRQEPLKLALLQRVRFRLRARVTTEAAPTRWWSSMSQPVPTGFAGPDGAVASIVAAEDRLTLVVQFSLNRRLAEAAATAGPAELRAQRADLFKGLEAQEDGQPTAAVKLISPAGGNAGGMQHSSWARGFGHAYVTRYQLRLRYQVTPGGSEVASAEGGDAAQAAAAPEWGSWEVYSDTALPREVDRGALGAGLFGGSAGGMWSSNPQVCWYSVEMPQQARGGRILQDGEIVQCAVRVGDGIKWSAWRSIKEVAIAVVPPRPPREHDAIKADWVGDVCTVSWPAATSPIGLSSIEYQLIVEPDSGTLPARFGAMLIGPSANSKHNEDKLDSQKKAAGGSRDERRGSVTNLPKQDPHRTERSATVELRDLCRDVRHSFKVLARYPTVGPRTFSKVYEIPKIAWRQFPGPRPHAGGRVRGGVTASAVAIVVPGARPPMMRLPPVPEQVRAPEGKQKLQRWQQDGDGRLIVLTWPGLEAVDHATTSPADSLATPVMTPTAGGKGGQPEPAFEVQVSEAAVAAQSSHRGAALAAAATTSGDELAAHGREWEPCQHKLVLTLDDVPCIALRALPCLVGQFRLFDPVKACAGPPSPPMVTVYERVAPAPAAAMRALGRSVPRTLAVELTAALDAPGGTQRWATHSQVRFRRLGGSGVVNTWEELDPVVLDASRGDEVSILVREDDGLELGPVYEFEVRVGDMYRLGPWSEPSRPLRFVVSPPAPQKDGGIRAAVEATSVELTWAPFHPSEALLATMPGFARLPVEYTVTVQSGIDNEPVATLVTRETRIIVQALSAGTAYTAKLVGRWARFCSAEPAGGEEAGQSLLAAAFVTAPSNKRLVAEISVRHQSEGARGHGSLPPTFAHFPVDGPDQSAVTVHLNPYYGGPRAPGPHGSPAYVRKPSAPPMLPSKQERSLAATAPTSAPAVFEGGGGRGIGRGGEARGDSVEPHPGDMTPPIGLSPRRPLPMIVPMPPPKFTTRDPLSFSLSAPAPDVRTPRRSLRRL